MGDMSEVLSSPAPSVQNGFNNHNGLAQPMEEDDNPSLNLINEIASSLSNQLIPRAPPPPPKPTSSYQSSEYQPAASTPFASAVDAPTLGDSDQVFAPSGSAVPQALPQSSPYQDPASILQSSPSRSSFKRVSKLNKKHPSISILEENVGYVTALALDSALSSNSSTTKNSSAPVTSDDIPSISTAETTDSFTLTDIPERMEHSNSESPVCDTISDQQDTICDTSSSIGSNTLYNIPDTPQSSTSSSTQLADTTTPHLVFDENPRSNSISSCTSDYNGSRPQFNSNSSQDSIDTSSFYHPQLHSVNSSNYSRTPPAPPLPHFNMPLNTPTANITPYRSTEEDQDSVLLMEKRSFRPFKSSEDYLYAMREDLAEWLNCLYELNINVDNFFEVLETGEVLCQHANAVKREAARSGRRLSAGKKIPTNDVFWRPGVEPGSFRARDNVSNFINWCRLLGVHEVLLFETDDLVLRKNEKHVILALLEVARQGHKVGMAAPLLVQMEDDIDRHEKLLEERRILQESRAMQESLTDDHFQEELAVPQEPEEPPQIFYGPTKQIVTNDLRSLDEMVRDLVERCACPSQFPMVKVSDGKYRIGDTRVLIFVRILRNHVMVRVGGGWDTLEHYLDKHDPCRCRSGHRTALSSHVGFKNLANSDRQLSSVTYDRCEDGSVSSPLAGRRRSSGPPRKDAAPSAVSAVSAAHAGSLRQRSQSPANMTRLHTGRVSASAAPSNGPPLEEVAGRSPEPPGWCDSSSEVSDEGYRSQGAPPRPSPRTRRHAPRKLSIGESNLTERPESSMTHTSSEGSTVSTDDLGVPPTPPRSPPAGDNTTPHCLSDHPSLGSGPRTHIPQLSRAKIITSTESLNRSNVAGTKKKKGSVPDSSGRPAWNSGPGSKKEDAKRRGSCADLSTGYSISRSRSTNSDNGFHSLTRNTPVRKSLSASRPSNSGTRLNDSHDSPSGASESSTGKWTWNGRNSRGRPPVNSDMYKPPAPPRGVRSASASPGPIRRNFGHSAPVTPQTRSPKQSAPNSTLASPTHTINKLPEFIAQKVVPDLGDINSKPSVEMLEQLEQLVNSYRVRVLDHFAEEGKAPPPELADDFSCSWARDTQSLTSSPKKTPRPSAHTSREKAAVKLTPRRDGLGSRIPAPTFFTARNTPS